MAGGGGGELCVNVIVEGRVVLGGRGGVLTGGREDDLVEGRL